jgi:hypothetical protein
MGVRLPTAAEIENLRRALEEEEHRRLKSEHTQPHIESVEAEIEVAAVVEEGAEESTESVIKDDVEEAAALTSVDDVVSMPSLPDKADAYSKPALNGKSKKR